MRITLDFRKTVEENAADFFEKAKKAKKKAEGAKKALVKTKAQLKKAEEKEVEIVESSLRKVKKRVWFEKFRWFISSNGFLVIGGRDATTNEIIIKKYTEDHDLVFHTEMAGSPFIVIKSEGKEIPEQTRNEAAAFCASFGRAWKRGLGTSEVYSIKPEQVSKDTKNEGYLAKGSFMIYGDRTYYNPELNIAVGIYEDKVMSGPVSAIMKNCKIFVEIVLGDKKSSDIAKIIKKVIDDELDEIIRALPPGTCDIKKN